MTPTVGFDLDMTLIDPRQGLRAVVDRLADELGLVIDVDLWMSRLGPPLEQELAHWVPAGQVDSAAERYRELSAEFGARQVAALPGARAAVEAVRADGGRVVVVTAKRDDLATLNLAAVGIEVDAVEGWMWGAGKAVGLRRHAVDVYVGDHPLDVIGARAAGALSVGVSTGGEEPCGADVVLADLTDFAAWWAEYLLESRLATLQARLAELGTVLVAFSGGADSAFLLAAAVRFLGPDRVVAATAVSPSLAAAELPAAAALASSLGVRHLTPATDELSRPGYVANGSDRCFHCKATLLETLGPLAGSLGLAAVATGTNADDRRAGFRPGIQAADERGAVTPLLDAGLTKAQIRELSRRWGLVTAEKPALACLASRLAYGVEVTAAGLAGVDRAESALRAHLVGRGVVVTDLRVRVLPDGAARVELDPQALDGCDDAALDVVRTAGYARVTSAVFRSGSLNDALTTLEPYSGVRGGPDD